MVFTTPRLLKTSRESLTSLSLLEPSGSINTPAALLRNLELERHGAAGPESVRTSTHCAGNTPRYPSGPEDLRTSAFVAKFHFHILTIDIVFF